jgi:hypothetical protein
MTILSKIFTTSNTMSGKLPRTRRSEPRPSSSQAAQGANKAKPQAQNVLQSILRAFDHAAEGMLKIQDIPLRLHRQWLTTFLACLILVGVISGIYLNITSRTAIAGREIQNMEIEIVANQQKNADLQTALAETLSNINLQDRAAGAGFVLITRDDIKYLSVPGYVPAQNPAPTSTTTDTTVSQELPVEYTETLITWLTRQLEMASTPLARNH